MKILIGLGLLCALLSVVVGLTLLLQILSGSVLVANMVMMPVGALLGYAVGNFYTEITQ